MPRCIALTDYASRIEDIRGQIEANENSPSVWGSTSRFLQRMQRRLTRPPRIAIVGEANTGKTTLANLMLGHELLITDIVNNTRAPILIRYAETAGLSALDATGARRTISTENISDLSSDACTSLELGLPLPILKKFEIIDTPGVSILGENFDRMAFVCRQADMAVWCTLATQAWRASERDLWRMVCDRTRSASLLAITHADALSGLDQSRVADRVQREAGPWFADHALVSQPVSAPQRTTDSGPATEELTREFLSKVDAALDRVEQRRLAGARRAVQSFIGRLGTKSQMRPSAELLRAAS